MPASPTQQQRPTAISPLASPVIDAPPRTGFGGAAATAASTPGGDAAAVVTDSGVVLYASSHTTASGATGSSSGGDGRDGAELTDAVVIHTARKAGLGRHASERALRHGLWDEATSPSPPPPSSSPASVADARRTGPTRHKRTRSTSALLATSGSSGGDGDVAPTLATPPLASQLHPRVADLVARLAGTRSGAASAVIATEADALIELLRQLDGARATQPRHDADDERALAAAAGIQLRPVAA